MGYPHQANERDDVEEGLLENEKEDEFFLPKANDSNFPQSRKRYRWWSWVLQFAIFLCSLTLFILSRYTEPSDAASPALEAVTYYDTTFQGTFDAPSPYRGTPTPELDWQWEEMIEGSAFNLPNDKLHLLNITEGKIPRWHHTEAKFGGGIAASGWDHCIELMRQDLVCQADVTPYFILDAPPGRPADDLKVDFSIRKKCRDFEKIKSWVRSHTTIESFKDSFVDGVELA
ncbi:hypothetical protein N0V90_010335 [Kalmusia sp. IMI 367209]|nr:hypothetical protein N0V90_010335 [Kalmusia sp. IMI 367209]